MEAQQALEKLLLSMFSADELRRLIRYLPGGDALSAGLPGANASLAALASETVAALVREGMIDMDFWGRLLAERPRRKPDIDGVRARFSGPGVAPTSGTRGASAESLPVVTVLLVSANPENTVRLRVDREFRNIITRMRGSRFRDRFKFVPVIAARFEDLTTALQEHEPQVLHISAHGDRDGSLIFESDVGESQKVSKRRVLQLLTALVDNLRLVVLNACHSHAIARDIPTVIDLAIGMSEAVGDQAAIDFAVAFYESLGFGRSVEAAFNVGLAQLEVVDDEIPRLFPAAADDGARKRKRSLITA
jgi:hypothetical protein